MGFIPLDQLEDLSRNRYEMVLIAARRARQLNAKRMAQLEMLTEENAEQVDIDSRKVTYIALQDCLEGRVRVAKPE